MVRIPTDTTQQYNSFGTALPTLVPSHTPSVNQKSCHNIIDVTFPLFSTCSVLPQTRFSLPNIFGHQTREEANKLLGAFQPALQSGCINHLRMFLCPLFFPPCDMEPILPCASFCRSTNT